MQIPPISSGSQYTGPSGPNFPLLQKDLKEFNQTLAQLQQALANGNSEAASQDIGILITLLNPNNSNSFFAAINGDQTLLPTLSHMQGLVSAMNTCFQDNDFSACEAIASSQGMTNDLANIRYYLIHP
jgi:hypothetical protein